MKESWRYFFGLIVLVLLLSLALSNSSLVYAAVIDPIARVLWLILRLFLTVNQGIYWALLLFVVFLVGLRMTPERKETDNHRTYSVAGHQEDRTAFWEAQICAAEDDVNARASLQLSLDELQSSITALVDGDEQKEIHLPPAASKTLAIWKRPGLYRPRNAPSGSKLEQSLGQILDSMETTLEIPHEPPTKNPHER